MMGVVVILLTVLIEVGTHKLDHITFHFEHIFEMVQRVYKELMLLGIISFMLFLVETAACLAPEILHELHIIHLSRARTHPAQPAPTRATQPRLAPPDSRLPSPRARPRHTSCPPPSSPASPARYPPARRRSLLHIGGVHPRGLLHPVHG